MRSTIAVVLVMSALGLGGTAAAGVTSVEIEATGAFADGASFGDTGSYERVKGRFRGELDPGDARNRVIANMDKATRNARGMIEYEADFFMLRPKEAQRGNRRIIYDVTNRGRMYVHWRLMDAKLASPAAGNDPRSLTDAGNGLLLRRGYTLVWSGWDPDAPRANNGLVMKSIVATDNGSAIVRTIRDELVSGTRGALRETFRLTHEAASLDQSQARLSVRLAEADPRQAIPASGWAYVNAREIRLLPEGTRPQPGALYELHYPAKNPRVLGIGMAATRDLIAFLRHETADAAGNANPAGPGIRAAVAFGISQSGRFLRDFVRDGFNQDTRGRKVFDGILAHTAGIGGVFLNMPFGQPGRTNTQHEDHMFPENAFPFSVARMTDPVTGRTGAVFRNDGFDPLWMETNTSTEYWQKGASLLATDPLGSRDVELPPNARGYLITGTQHGGQAWMTASNGNCANPRNPHSPTPALRALLIALDEWVDGKPPPASRVPRIADGTLVRAEQVRFPAIPGMQVARRVNEIGVLQDWVKPQMDMSKPYRPLVPQVDAADGNELAGIRLPEIAAPLATYTGWNLYRAPYAEGELCDRFGSYKPLLATRGERETAGDPRPSLQERYGDHASYLVQFERVARALVAERLLLPEDAERLIAHARTAEVAQRFMPGGSEGIAARDAAADEMGSGSVF
jgi:hypothetical protein